MSHVNTAYLPRTPYTCPVITANPYIEIMAISWKSSDSKPERINFGRLKTSTRQNCMSLVGELYIFFTVCSDNLVWLGTNAK